MNLFDNRRNLKWLFWMTHPDDEIAICAWIRRLVAAEKPVYLCWSHSDPEREAEARAAADLLGVPQDHLRFFNGRNRTLCHHLSEILPPAQEWVDHVKPDRICCGAFEQGHMDHDATNMLVNRIYRGPVLEIPFYHNWATAVQTFNRFTIPKGEEILELTEDEQDFKKRLAKMYPSQRIWNNLLMYEALQTARLKRGELVATERMRLQTHKDFLRPNHPPVLAAKLRNTRKWRRWAEAVAHFEQSPNPGKVLV